MGRRKTGKTYFSQNTLIANTSLPKVLIVDTLDHPSWRHIPEFPALTENNLKNFTKGTYRIFREDPDEVLEMLSKYANNCLLIFEDATKYLEPKLQPDAKRLMVDSKQRNNDICFMFHDWGFCPKDIWRFADLLTIKHTNTSPASRKSSMGAYEVIHAAYLKVKAQKDNPFAEITIRIGG